MNEALAVKLSKIGDELGVDPHQIRIGTGTLRACRVMPISSFVNSRRGGSGGKGELGES